ncbi:Flp family type IVb pilin [Roseovarius autotrophicus]|uniref:Flp family type IVb pilin n=1 Tax=Roseovarius autotrophicus TaxID=2824121 RepID=UPI0019DAFE39|nr:hypothetical protein [Roseovarius autotrophicus]MBE0453818.1 hypothetical protein [Roseovarius sp.]
MIKFFKNFSKDEDGAVTVDWVVLTAAVVGLGIAGVAAVNNGVVGLAGNIETAVGGATVTGPTSLGFGN